MRLLFYMTFFLTLFGIIFVSECVSQEAVSDEWEVLFNGENLKGWHLLNGQHQVEVKNGTIVATTVDGLPNGFLATKKEYGDFILEVEVKADVLMHNSGIQFRNGTYKKLTKASYMIADSGRVYGYQAEIENTPQKWSGAIFDEARRGWLYILEDEDSPAKDAFKNNQWNKYRIEAIGHTMRVWINGIPTSHLIDDETAKGFIALQIHDNTRPESPDGNHQIRFRNIRIKTDNIKPSPYDEIPVVNLIPNFLSGQEEAKGFSLLWDGKTTSGWRGISQSTKIPESGWSSNRGILTISALKGKASNNSLTGIMKTQKKYGPFELKFDFKQHEKGGILGIEYGDFSNISEVGDLYGRWAAKKTKETGQWNRGRIKVFPDNKVEYWLNGYKILEYYRNKSFNKGPIVLGSRGNSISYRSIKIRELK